MSVALLESHGRRLAPPRWTGFARVLFALLGALGGSAAMTPSEICRAYGDAVVMITTLSQGTDAMEFLGTPPIFSWMLQ